MRRAIPLGGGATLSRRRRRPRMGLLGGRWLQHHRRRNVPHHLPFLVQLPHVYIEPWPSLIVCRYRNPFEPLLVVDRLAPAMAMPLFVMASPFYRLELV